MKRFMLDSNIADKLHADAAVQELVRALSMAGRIEVLRTAVQSEEVGRTPVNRNRGAKLAAINEARKVDEVGFFLDASHLDEAVFGTDDEHAVVEAVRGQRVSTTSDKKHLNRTNDGIIAASAISAGAVLVTENWKDFGDALPLGLVVWTFADLRAWLMTEAAAL